MKALIALLFLPTVALAGAFDGTWKMNLASAKVTGKPDVYSLVDGTYTCSSCDPPLIVKADGAEHAVSGHVYYDTAMVKVTGPKSVEVTVKQGGKLVNQSVVTVSDDGQMLTGKYTSYTGAKPITGGYSEKRVAPGPAGSHAVSGSWQGQTMAGDDTSTTIRFRETPDGFAMEWNGQKYEARFDGKQYPLQGDAGKTMVSVKKIDASTIEETDYRQGKTADVIRNVLSKDGKSIAVTDQDVVHGQTTTYTLDKQPGK